MSEHVHTWTLNLHRDGCHFFQSGYGCECGAVRVTSTERDMNDDPYSAVWMDGGGDECERCEELKAGAKPTASETIVEATT